MKGFFVLLLASLAACEIKEGKCPEFTNIATFDTDAYLGRWYEQERFFAEFEAYMECVTADYGPHLDGGFIGVVDAGYRHGEVIYTVANASETNVTGQWAMNSPDGETSIINVLDTDYHTYSSVYACVPLTDREGFMDEFAFILSREREISNFTLETALDAYIKFNITVADFIVTSQGPDCQYLPPPVNITSI